MEKSKKVKSVDIWQTDDYTIFKKLEGNREIEESHVKELIRSIQKYGNRTQDFPILVTDKMEIFDGQHRVNALKELGFPVFYQVIENITLDDARLLNNFKANWTWRNYAESYAGQGNANYTRFMQTADMYPVGYRVLLAYVANRPNLRGDHDFRVGDLKYSLESEKATHERLERYQGISKSANFTSAPFAYAVLSFMNRPHYDQERMEEKMAANSKHLLGCYTVDDYLYALETIYNR